MQMRIDMRCAAAVAALLAITGCSSDDESGTTSIQAQGSDDAPAARSSAVDDAALASAGTNLGEWLTHGRDYAEQRFSPLDQINAATIERLGLAWHYDTDALRGMEATPLIHDGVLYATTSWSNAFAVDAVTGEELWYWDAQADRVRGARACCDVVNRGVALYADKVFVGIIDGRLVALDAATGAPIWDVQTTPVDLPYTITGAPRIVDGKVIIGNGGAEYGVRGYVSAYDPDSGELIWRTYTVPGDPALGFESEAMAAAAETWTGEWWELGGGGTAWDAIAYDPTLNLLYVGTGNGSPWNHNIRSPEGGDNLYLSSILALNADDGELVWHYQTTPGDNWDYTATQPLMLAELTIEGRDRQVIMQAPKNGFFYVLDRVTGELLSAEPFAGITWASGIDMQTGRPIETAQARYGREITVISPGPGGAHSWHPMSFHPDEGLVYIPAQQSSLVYAIDNDFNPIRGVTNLGVPMVMPPEYVERPADQYDPGTGEALPGAYGLIAWDPVAQERRWLVDLGAVPGGGTLATAGDLVFQGRGDGQLVAYAADSGETVWELDLGNGIMAPPVTYAIDGQQYLSVLVGWGSTLGLFGSYPAPEYKASGRLYTFALDADAPFEPVTGIERPSLTAIEFETTPEQLDLGATIYGERCFFCHGFGGAAGGQIADLRYATPETYQNIDAIVRGGAYQGLGMPQFGFLTEDDTAALRAFLLTQRQGLIDSL